MSFPADITALSELLEEKAAPERSPTSSAIVPNPGASHATVVRSGAAAVAGTASAANAGGGAAAAAVASKPDPNAIWDSASVPTVADVLAAPDGRARPVFDFAFKQRVGTGDVFLGLSGTTPSSIHCDTLVMKIVLPGERFADIDLDVNDTRISLSAARYKLSTFFPQKVLHRDARAAWDAAKSTLSITLPIDPSTTLLGGLGSI